MISLVMATFNGAKTLPLTLKALAAVAPPEDGLEIIVVDNASTDATPAILDAHRESLGLTVLREPTPGRSRALNRGCAAATGELVVMSDDDVLPDPGWLRAFDDAARAHPSVSIFAGQVRIHWQKPPPGWLVRLSDEGRSYGATPRGQAAGPISPGAVKGANVAVRKALLRRARLREDVGYGANGAMLAGDETAFVRAAADSGHEIRFVPEARLCHIVRPHEVAMRPVLRRYFRIGRGSAAIGTRCFRSDLPTLFGYPRFLFRQVTTDTVGALAHLLALNRYRCMRALIDIAMTCGEAYQWKQMQGSARGQSGDAQPAE